MSVLLTFAKGLENLRNKMNATSTSTIIVFFFVRNRQFIYFFKIITKKKKFLQILNFENIIFHPKRKTQNWQQCKIQPR